MRVRHAANPGRSRARLAVAVAIAAVLHVCVAAVIAGSDGMAGPSGTHAAVEPRATPMQVRSVIVQGLLATPAQAAPVEPAFDAAESAEGTSAPQPSIGTRYFDVSEVDTPAMPLPEWQVDVAMLMAQGARSVSVDVLISEAGVAQQCAVTRVEPPQPPDLLAALASRLCETTLRPALRQGLPVLSVRHIELVLAAD
jgi:hypothetical protein